MTTETEAQLLAGLDSCPLHKRTPFAICGVSETQFSVARHYGGIDYNGEKYTYFPASDVLVRDDVLRWKAKLKLKTKTK